MTTRGFTILEILVVIVIISLLALIAIPSIGILQARGESAKCLSNLRQIGIALQAYLADNNTEMPTLLAGRRSVEEAGPVLDDTLSSYTDNMSIFLCPADRTLGKQSGTSYYWNSALNGQRAGSLNFLQLVDALSRIPILSDKEGWHRFRDNKVNFLYADGHASTDLKLLTGD
jgi:prepilin-type N-terminal cleavage/methylation domain-containing protein/prepilin-type processing-associated H-X9-DG protein